MNKRLYIDFHVLQTVPPSCVNRDDTGSPKTAVYGGATRARVSSQAWKRAMRRMFDDLLPKEQIGARTKRIVSMVAHEIAPEFPDTARERAMMLLQAAGVNVKDEEKGTDALFFMSYAQAKALAQQAGTITDAALKAFAAWEQAEKKDKAKKKLDDELKPLNKPCNEALKSAPSADMALFGRMVADDPTLNYDAAAQVAHAISTHAVQNEFDYFTAVDDLMPEDNAGAGHLGTVEFNSATLYRYATVNALELCKHLGAEETPRVVRAFAEAFVRAMPTGKQNTFANRTLPDAVIVTIREDQPVNLCGAFERAIPASAEGFVARSGQALADYAKNLYATYVDAPARTLKVGPDLPFPALLGELEREVAARLAQVSPETTEKAEKD